MIRNIFKKSSYKPIEKIGDGEYRLMWGKCNLTDKTYQKDNNGNIVFDDNNLPIIVNETETDFCTCCSEIVKFPKNGDNIVSIIDSGIVMGYDEPSMEEWVSWSNVFVSNSEQISFIRERLKDRIRKYDKKRGADGVENFTINGINLWLDKDTRTGLLLRFQAEKASGKTDTILWHEGMAFPLLIESGIQMLYAIEVYASATYDLKEQLLAAADKLESVDELISFDETRKNGYPAQLAF